MKLHAESTLAEDSNDHICPVGCVNDNYTNSELIDKVEAVITKKPMFMLDLGCAGGQFVADFIDRGHLGFGLEGSSHALKGAGGHNWNVYNNINLFLCDVTKPFHFEHDDSNMLFDFIHCSEMIEHLKPEDLSEFFANVHNNLADKGVFCCQINLGPDVRVENGKEIVLHHSIFSGNEWKTKLIRAGFIPCKDGDTNVNHLGYLFGNTKFRDHQSSSIYMCLTK